MKKHIVFLCVAALMSALSTGFVACDETKTSQNPEQLEGIGIAPVSDLPEETVVFLKANSFRLVTAVGAYRDLTNGRDFCTMVNSADELLQALDDGRGIIELPAIDFDLYTLVLGGWFEGGSGRVLTDKRLVVGSEKITMYIHTELPPGHSGTDSPIILPYAELYPKLPQLPVEVVRK